MNKETRPRTPPLGTRFKKGESGNPKGRPKAKVEKAASAFDILVDKTLPLTRNGVPYEATLEEALQWRIYQDALKGNRPARREVLKMIAKREKFLAEQRAKQSPVKSNVTLLTEPADPENAVEALLLLGIVDYDPSRPRFHRGTAQLLLEPWAVQMALSRRRGGAKLNEQEVSEIKRTTRDPNSLRWPRGTPE